jgi:hypothetical protein
MVRVVEFADSFVSASEPSIEGAGQENYVIENNATNEIIFSIDSENYQSAFLSYELIRKDESTFFIETGEMQLIYNGTEWNYARNIFINDEIFVSEITSPEHVVLSMVTTDGVGDLVYNSGNMGLNYEGTFRISIVRIVTV